MSKKTTTVDGNEVIVTGRTNRLMVAFTAGLVGGAAGGISAFLGINLIGRLIIRGAKKQQIQQFQNEYR